MPARNSLLKKFHHHFVSGPQTMSGSFRTIPTSTGSQGQVNACSVLNSICNSMKLNFSLVRPLKCKMSHGLQASGPQTTRMTTKLQVTSTSHPAVQRSSTPILSNILKSGPGNTRSTYTPRDENPPGAVSGAQMAKTSQRKSPVSMRKSPVSEQKPNISNLDRIKPKPKLSQGSPSYGSSRGA